MTAPTPQAVEAPPVVLRDTFPAQVVAGDRVWSAALAVITRDRVHVYAGDRLLVLDEPYDPAASTVPAYNDRPREPAHLALLSGQVVTVTRQRGCGCSSRLRGWRPWRPYVVAPA